MGAPDSNTAAAEGTAPPGTAVAPERQRSPRRLIGGALGLVAAGFLALWQAPWPDPETRPSGLAWLLYPLEVNPELRLPQVQGDLQVLCAEPGGERLWAAGRGGLLLRSVDGGGSWRLQNLRLIDAPPPPPPRSKAWLRSLSPLSTALAGALPGDEPLVKSPEFNQDVPNRAADAPASQQQAPVTQALAQRAATVDVQGLDFRAMDCAAPDSLWLSWGENLLLRSADGGERWQVVPSDDAPVGVLERDAGGAVSAPNAANPFRWQVGADGLIVKTLNPEGPTPIVQRQAAPASRDLKDIVALDAERAWIAGIDGTLLRTRDGGAHWFAQTRPYTDAAVALGYLRLPAPWFYPTALLLWGFANARTRSRETASSASVADLLVSDRPLQRGDPNTEQLGEIAAGLSRFLRNDKTEPPLTLAVTGPWGSGKSSLMNLLRDDLRARGFRPVWFNAWHHQKGEQLLASLFAEMKRGGIPPLASIAGINFRLNLLLRRGWQRWFSTSLMLLFLAALAAYALRRPEQLPSLTEVLKHFSAGAPEEGLLRLLQQLLIPGTLALPPLLVFMRAVRAFRLNPVVLMDALAVSGKDSVLNQQPAARSRFADEFADVTEALGDYRLVLFIDDLDRCEAAHVVEVLEAVNFLVSSGRCYVVLGMDDKWVQTCIGLAYEDIAEERAELEQDQSSGPDQRRRFARGYLEKLVNIEVPVPRLSEAAARRLLAPAEVTRASPLARAVRGALAYAPWLLVLVPLWLGMQLGGWLDQRMPSDVAPAAAEAGAETSSAATADTPGTDDTARSRTAVALPSRYREGQSGSNLPRAAALALVLVLVFTLLRQLARHQAVTQDSRQFRDALELWHPWIAAQQKTPRAIKRFLNRLRYLAMRNRREPEPTAAAWWRRVVGQAAATPKVAAAPRFPESTLVALGAIHELLPEAFTGDPAAPLELRIHDVLQSRREALVADLGADDARRLLASLEQTLREHAADNAGLWPPTPEQIEEFLAILARTKMR